MTEKIFTFRFATEKCKLGYYGIQCVSLDSQKGIWECVFPEKMSNDEIEKAISELFEFDELKNVREIRFSKNGFKATVQKN